MSVTEEMGRPFTIEEIKERVIPVLKKYGVEEVLLYGSYAKGCATTKSDVDMIVKSQQKGIAFIGLLLAVEETLGGVTLDLYDVRELKEGITLDNEPFRSGVRLLC